MSPYRKAYLEWRQGYLRAVLEQHGGNVTAASKYSGIHRSTFYRDKIRSTKQPHLRGRGNAEWRSLDG